MIRKYMLPLMAASGVVVAIITIIHGNQPAPVAPLVAQPAKAPFASYVAGAASSRPAPRTSPSARPSPASS